MQITYSFLTFKLFFKYLQQMQEQSRQGLLFSFIQQINKAQPSKQMVLNAIKIAYILQLILAFFIISDPDNVAIVNFIKQPFLSLVLACFVVFLFTEILIAIFYNFHFQLMIQISFFRYIIFPLFLLALAQEIKNPNTLTLGSAVIAYLLLTLFCTLITFITFNQFSEQQLKVNSCRFSVLLIISDSLMMAVTPLSNKEQYPILLVIWFALELLVLYNRKMVFMQKISKLIKLMIHQKQFFLYLFYITTVLFPKIEDRSIKIAIIVSSLPIIFILSLYIIFQVKNVKIDEEIFRVEAPFSSFSTLVYKLSEQLFTYKTNLNKKFEQSFMLTFIDAHFEKCELSNCLLAQKSTIQQLKNCNEASNRRTIFYKVIKKLQFLFELYEQRYPNDLELKILLLQFYSAHLPNKIKLRQTIQKIKKQRLGFQQKLLLHRLTKSMKKIQTVELIDFSKPEDEYHNIKKIILENLTYLKEFWNVLLQEKVDINKLINISAKLFHLKCQLEVSWKKHLNEIKFISWKIIKLYAIYRRFILHDSTKANILEDYCKIVEERIKSKFQLAYMSVQTEKGLIAISLSESSLGNILTVNNQTVKLFSYSTKSQMIALRVNDIMPIVYSIVHDGILASFLKNRYKKINQDQRLLFAKNKNGFIFPFLLQLNKMSWNSNDELIFISNVQLRKSKKAPIFCITDQQGYVHDKTSNYHWLFNNNKKKEKGSVQNIQQIIPNFFQIVQEDMLAKTSNKFQFQQRVVVKKTSGQIQVAFSAVSLFIKNQRVGYLVEGNTVTLPFTLSQKKSIKQILQQKDLGFYKNNFNLPQFRYQICNKYQSHSKLAMRGDQLSIPYIRTIDFNNLFKKQLFQNTDYGQSIKTLRLKNNKLQLAVEQQSFQSYEMDSQAKQMSVMKRIQQMKQELNVEQNKDLSIYYRIIAIVTCLLIVGLSAVVIGNTLGFQNQQMQQNLEIINKSSIRKLLPQYLIYLYFPIQMPDFQAVKQSLRSELVDTIMSSSIEQNKKEDIMKSIYYGQLNQTLYFQQQMLNFNYDEANFNANIFNLLYTFLTCAAIYVAILFLMFIFFKSVMNHIYSIFLSINDKKLQLILLQSTKLHKYLSDKIVQQDIFQVFHQQVSQNSEEQFERVKKTKTQFSSQDWKMLCQLVFPMLFVLGFGIFTTIFMTIQLNNHNKTFQIWKNTQKLFPQTSVVMLQELMNQMKGKNLSLSNNFDSLMQQFQKNILVEQLDFNQQILSLKGDPCKDESVFASLQTNINTFCSNARKFQNSLSNQLNFIYMYLKDKNVKSQTEWSILINREYNLVKPLLQNASQIVKNVMESQRNQIKKSSFVIIIIQIILIVIATLYISCYPIKTISQQLLFTKDLISIIPADRDIMPIQALATLTNEAIEFKQSK